MTAHKPTIRTTLFNRRLRRVSTYSYAICREHKLFFKRVIYLRVCVAPLVVLKYPLETKWYHFIHVGHFNTSNGAQIYGALEKEPVLPEDDLNVGLNVSV